MSRLAHRSSLCNSYFRIDFGAIEEADRNTAKLCSWRKHVNVTQLYIKQTNDKELLIGTAILTFNMWNDMFENPLAPQLLRITVDILKILASTPTQAHSAQIECP